MLKLEVVLQEGVTEDNEIVVLESFDLELEHSLVSLSKWESKFEKPFAPKDPKTDEEVLWYVGAMTLTPNVPPEVYRALTTKDFEKISAYINSKQTATWFREVKGGAVTHTVVTSEIIYYLMCALNIDWEAQHWHLNRLMTLIRVIQEKNAPTKKVDQKTMLDERRAENARRRKMYETTG